ncbi:MAG TPA: chemotaxis protein CheW [Chloroflexi bacterium]|jgi:purine-binding chemotaxis protein CheW|nr:chemotaxis protein CheW [Chloroflexota bacterium]
MANITTRTTEEQVVVFSLAGEHYGLDISRIQGIIKLPEITRVPRAPRFVEGIINLRGAIVPVIDLRKRFRLGERTDTRETRIINVEMGDHLVGLIVDAVEEVLNIPPDAVEPTPELVTTLDSAYLRGIAKLDDRLVILLDLDRALSLSEQQALEEMDLAPQEEESIPVEE